MRFDTKIAIIVHDELAAWQKLNVTAFLSGGLVAAAPDLGGQAYRDGSGKVYGPLVRQPILIFAATSADLTRVLRRAAESGHAVSEAPVSVREPAERALAMSVARFSPAVVSAAEALEPHRLCGHLYEIATEFSRFYENCPILAAEDPTVRASRLRLAELTSRALATGLMLLGISAPPRL